MNFTAFFSYTFLTAYTPGPNNILSMTNASRDGLKKTRLFLAGVFTGFVVVMSLCALCSSLLYVFIPSIQPVLRYIGAAYILWIAWTIWQDKPHSGKGGISQTNSFQSGMLLQFVNVKIILYGMTAMSTYILPFYNKTIAIVGFSLMLAAIGVSGCCCWAAFGAIFQSFFQKYRKPLNAIMSLMLVYCAASLFL